MVVGDGSRETGKEDYELVETRGFTVLGSLINTLGRVFVLLIPNQSAE